MFLGAAGIWVLGVVLLNRRELARKAVTLERLQSRLLDNLPDGLVHLDGHGGVLAANPAAHVLLGVQEGALVGRNSLALGPQAAALLAGEVETLARPVPWRQQQHGDRFLEVLSLPMEDGSGERLVLLRDRTELNKLEERLSDARRLATVGVLAAGVAHEIRNPLSALRGFAQFFAKKLAGKHPEEQYANTMVSEADRLNRVVGDLLNLARPRVLSPVMVDLQALGDELGRLLEQDFAAAGAVFSTDFQARTCYADADALKQCLLNLVLNSLQAVAGQANTPARAAPEGVTVLPLTVRLGAQASAGDAGCPGNVEVYVEDNGPGMDDAERRHAFDPFYTSKPKGAGLGLALVEKTMREHGGSARMESAPGRGTVVRLLFPLPRHGTMPANPSAEDVA
ncbi:MAG: PAS domain-containing protein [Desulfovibrio sp.]|nr:PAS domain-containing protein [Desulfovibrio sp.]